jgi:phage terminase large subunit
MDDEVQTQTIEPLNLGWYKPGKSLSEFHACNVPVRVLVGGRGSGKTTSVGVEVIGHGLHNAGAKIYILRKTQDSNEDTTLDTFEQVFKECGTGFQETDISLFKRWRAENTSEFRRSRRQKIQ